MAQECFRLRFKTQARTNVRCHLQTRPPNCNVFSSEFEQQLRHGASHIPHIVIGDMKIKILSAQSDFVTLYISNIHAKGYQINNASSVKRETVHSRARIDHCISNQ